MQPDIFDLIEVRANNHNMLLGITNPGHALRLQRLSKLLRSEAERQCNVSMDDQELNESNAKIACWVETATELAADYGYQVYHQPDPRGWSLYLYQVKNLHGRNIENCYSTEGIGVCSL